MLCMCNFYLIPQKLKFNSKFNQLYIFFLQLGSTSPPWYLSFLPFLWYPIKILDHFSSHYISQTRSTGSPSLISSTFSPSLLNITTMVFIPYTTIYFYILRYIQSCRAIAIYGNYCNHKSLVSHFVWIYICMYIYFFSVCICVCIFVYILCICICIVIHSIFS